jgi:S-adenosylmethionine-diacylglycerol 3-amino-3-carboxypropyl transferase
MSRGPPTLAGISRPRAPNCKGLALKPAQTLSDKLDQKVFTAIYSRSLVYNTCWEDPAVDRRALRLTPSDTVLAITSAGCNVLDYALVGPHRIHAVDANPRQTALLELKLAGIRQLDFEDFFDIFGRGHHSRFRELFARRLRNELAPFARDYWERRIHWFEGRNASFYYHGLSGVVARLFQSYLRLRPRLGAAVSALFDTRCLDEQRHIYDKHIRPFMWSAGMNWTLSRQITMSMLGVPMPQRREVMAQHAGGVPGFVREAIEYVFRFLPVWTNYFWAVYLRGCYSQTCCPEYLKPDNFAALKGGLADRIQPHSCTVTEFLHGTDERISKYVLLDHMDWMSCYYPEALVEEWEAILSHATPDARIILRSAHARPAYLDSIAVGSARQRLREALRFHDDLARELTRDDRVHTYAGFHIADVRT